MELNLVSVEEFKNLKLEFEHLKNQRSNNAFDFISLDELSKITGLGKVTIWRLENTYESLKSYKFKGSNKKFYKISELETALQHEA